MRGRVWLLLGAAVGIAVGLGHLAFLSGAATSFASTAERVVGSWGSSLVRAVAKSGSPRRVVRGLFAVCGLLVPGIAALLLVLAGRASLYLRMLIAALLAAVGIAGLHYLPHGEGAGTLAVGLVAATVVLAATGPLVAAPLVALAALIGTVYLPRVVAGGGAARGRVDLLHEALFGSPGAPLYLRLVALLLAALPFGVAARLLFR